MRIADVPKEDPYPLVGKVAVWTGSMFLSAGSGCCDDPGPPTIVGYSPATNSWRQVTVLPATALFSGPLSGFPSYLWTGRDVVFAGGSVDVPTETPDGTVYRSQAVTEVMAYTPSTSTWRRLAALPDNPPAWWHGPITDWPFGESLSVRLAWTGSEVLLLSQEALFRYDMAANTWRIAAPPPRAEIGPVVVWTGSRLLVWGGYGNQDPFPALRTGSSYDPVADAWTAIPSSPVTPRATTVWTGTELLSWGGPVGGVGYNPRTRVWRSLPWAPFAVTGNEPAVWTGRELFAWSSTARKAAAYDPATNRWRSIPVGPAAPTFANLLAWTGRAVLALGGWPRGTTQADLDSLGQLRTGTYAAAWVPDYPR